MSTGADDLDVERLLVALEYQPRHADWLFLQSLGEEHRRRLIVRLVGLVKIRGGSTVEKASEAAEVSVPTMYRLKKMWGNADKRSLEGLAGFAVRRVRGPGRDERLTAARRVARAMTGRSRAVDDLPVKSFARLIQERSSGPISMTAALAIAREARRGSRLGSRRLAETYGREIILDSCAVSLTLAAPAGRPPDVAILALVVEVGAGLILAANVSRETEAVGSQETAIGQARRFLLREEADVHGDGAARLSVVVGPSTDISYAAVTLALTRQIGADNVTASGPRRFGRRTIAVIGPDLGRLRLIPAATVNGRAAAASVRLLGRTAMSVEVAQSVVDRIVQTYNAPILGKLRSRSIIAPGSGAGRMDVALEKALAKSTPGRSSRLFL